MTGAYVRIQRGGEWVKVEMDQMTDDELTVFAQAQELKRGWDWAVFLAKWIRDNVRERERGDGLDR
jgi:hypothetical protein